MKNPRNETKALFDEYSSREKIKKKKAPLPNFIPKIHFRPIDRKNTKTKGLIYLFVADPNHPLIRTKPDGVKSIGIRIAVVDEAEVPANITYKTLTPSLSTYIKLLFTEQELNKRIFIKAYYIGLDDKEGPDSEVVSTIIR